MERSGLLREPKEGSLEFLHNTFKEFLAGEKIALLGDAGHLAHLCQDAERNQSDHHVPKVDWSLYGWTCHKQHCAMLKASSGLQRAFEIKKEALRHDQDMRLWEGNARDVIKRFVEKGILKPVYVDRRPYPNRPRYELTGIGKTLQFLLFRADTK